MNATTTVKFREIDTPDFPTTPGAGRGRSPLTDAILSTLKTGKAIEINLEDRKVESYSKRLRRNLKRYGVTLRIRVPMTTENLIYVRAVPDRTQPELSSVVEHTTLDDFPPNSTPLKT